MHNAAHSRLPHGQSLETKEAAGSWLPAAHTGVTLNRVGREFGGCREFCRANEQCRVSFELVVDVKSLFVAGTLRVQSAALATDRLSRINTADGTGTVPATSTPRSVRRFSRSG